MVGDPGSILIKLRESIARNFAEPIDVDIINNIIADIELYQISEEFKELFQDYL